MRSRLGQCRNEIHRFADDYRKEIVDSIRDGSEIIFPLVETFERLIATYGDIEIYEKDRIKLDGFVGRIYCNLLFFLISRNYVRYIQFLTSHYCGFHFDGLVHIDARTFTYDLMPAGTLSAMSNITAEEKSIYDRYWCLGRLHELFQFYFSDKAIDIDLGYQYVNAVLEKCPDQNNAFIHVFIDSVKECLKFGTDHQEVVNRARMVMNNANWWKRPLVVLFENVKISVRLPRLFRRQYDDNGTYKVSVSPMISLVLNSFFPLPLEIETDIFLNNFQHIHFPRFVPSKESMIYYPSEFRRTMKTLLLVAKRTTPVFKTLVINCISHYVLWNCFQDENPIIPILEREISIVSELSSIDIKKEYVRRGFACPAESKPISALEKTKLVYIRAGLLTPNPDEMSDLLADHAGIESLDEDLSTKQLLRLRTDEIIERLHCGKAAIVIGSYHHKGNIKTFLNRLIRDHNPEQLSHMIRFNY